MIIYSLIIIYLLFCIYKFDLQEKETVNSFPFFLIITCLILLSGLSYRMGGDGYNYEKEYSSYYTLLDERVDLGYFYNFQNRLPGWVFLNTLCKTFSSSWVLFRIIFSIIFNGLVGRFIWRNCQYPYTILLFYFILVYFGLNFEVMRGALAVAVFLNSIEFYLNRQWLKYYMCCIMALSFHDSAIVTFLVPLLVFWTYNKKNTISLLIIIGLVVALRDILLERSLTFFTNEYIAMRVSHYVSQYETGNAFSLYQNMAFNVLLPIVIVFYLKKKELDNENSKFVLAYILIYTFSMVFPIGHRFNHFFVIFYYVLIVDFLSAVLLMKNIKKVVPFIALCCLFIAFKARTYLALYGETEIPTYVQYIPYTSIFEQTKYPDREKILDDAQATHSW